MKDKISSVMIMSSVSVYENLHIFCKGIVCKLGWVIWILAEN